MTLSIAGSASNKASSRTSYVNEKSTNIITTRIIGEIAVDCANRSRIGSIDKNLSLQLLCSLSLIESNNTEAVRESEFGISVLTLVVRGAQIVDLVDKQSEPLYFFVLEVADDCRNKDVTRAKG